MKNESNRNAATNAESQADSGAAIEPEVLPPEGDASGGRTSGARDGQAEAPGRIARILWTALAIVCGVYIFVPEITDAVPVIGWLDEATAAAIVLYALGRLGIRIPWIQPVIDWFLGRRAKR